ncbi:MAG: YggS family pyridoxal phosphate-dependent enzyme [Rhodospirillales bacterium]|nr:YggS family pyridoxal phosphate-dependent enzyme [Rhodospirillales bacterium]
MPTETDCNQSNIGERLTAVRRTIANAAVAAGRDPESVTLVAVSKTHPGDVVRQALLAGQKVFGENRIQEAEEKWPALRAEFPDLALHLIGPLQRNKVKRAVRLFDVIETIDRADLATAVAKAADEAGRRPSVFIQVNTGEEPQKAGVAPEEADALVRLCREECGLTVRGLMCIPPIDEEPSLHFALLREIARRNELKELSMGMSGDYEVAVQFGATSVRVGTAIFGERPLSPDPPQASIRRQSPG